MGRQSGWWRREIPTDCCHRSPLVTPGDTSSVRRCGETLSQHTSWSVSTWSLSLPATVSARIKHFTALAYYLSNPHCRAAVDRYGPAVIVPWLNIWIPIGAGQNSWAYRGRIKQDLPTPAARCPLVGQKLSQDTKDYLFLTTTVYSEPPNPIAFCSPLTVARGPSTAVRSNMKSEGKSCLSSISLFAPSSPPLSNENLFASPGHNIKM